MGQNYTTIITTMHGRLAGLTWLEMDKPVSIGNQGMLLRAGKTPINRETLIVCELVSYPYINEKIFVDRRTTMINLSWSRSAQRKQAQTFQYVANYKRVPEDSANVR